MEAHYDTVAIIASIIGTGIALWRINKGEMDRLHSGLGNVRNDLSGEQA